MQAMIERLSREYQEFNDRFLAGDWTPTLDERLRHAEVSRNLLIATLQMLPGVSDEVLQMARRHVDPAVYKNEMFLEFIYAACATRREPKEKS